MGNSLPVESKFTFEEENDRIKYVVSSMQGWGEKMEDAVSKLAAFCMKKKGTVLQNTVTDICPLYSLACSYSKS